MPISSCPTFLFALELFKTIHFPPHPPNLMLKKNTHLGEVDPEAAKWPLITVMSCDGGTTKKKNYFS